MSRKTQSFVTILTKIHPSVKIGKHPKDSAKEQELAKPCEKCTREKRSIASRMRSFIIGETLQENTVKVTSNDEAASESSAETCTCDKITLKDIEYAIENKLGNYPANQVPKQETNKSIVDRIGNINLIHFASMHVIAGKAPKERNTPTEPHYLFLELTVDGPPEIAIASFVKALEKELICIYRLIDPGLKNADAITRQLISDQYQIKRSPTPAMFDANCVNGLPFSGTSGLDLVDMRDDATIAAFAQDVINDIGKEPKPKDKNGTDGKINNESDNEENFPGDVFRNVKKAIVEERSNPELHRAWKRATSKKETPNFAESMDSNWRAEWSQFKLFTSVIPAWVKTATAMVYVSLIFFISYMFTPKFEYGSEIKLWDDTRYSGSPFYKWNILGNAPPSIENVEKISLYPWFIFHGFLWASILYFILRISPPMLKRASGILTLVTGFNIYLWFPGVFNLNRLQASKLGIGEQIPEHPIIEVLFFLIVLIAVYTFFALLRRTALARFPKIFTRVYNKLHQWIYFLLAVALLAGYLYLGANFFFDNTYKFDYIYKDEKILRIEQYILVPALLSLVLCLNIQAIFSHLPTSLRSLENPFSRLKSYLDQFSHRIKKWNAGRHFKTFFFVSVFAVSHFVIYKAGFTQSESQQLNTDFTQQIKEGVWNIARGIALAGMLSFFSAHLISSLRSTETNLKATGFTAFLFWIAVLFGDSLAGDQMVNIYGRVLLAIPVTIIVLGLILSVALITYLISEQRNKQRYDNPYTDVTEKLFTNENRIVQNHMISVQRLIPENYRRYITMPLMLEAIIGVLGKQRFRPGFLANVGTVHSARWIHLPETDNYVFVSNYDGSFESYLEDFAKMATEGTNLAWDNCIGFPKIKGLFNGGVQDSDRFKRYARRSMQATPFWYSSVSDKSAEQIRRNALIRDGLTQDSLSASQSQAWLDLFTSIPRPEWVIEKDKVQNIVFGANGQLTEGRMYTVKAEENFDNKALATNFSIWVDLVKKHITFDGERPQKKAAYIAFSATGLRKLGLDHVLDDISGPDNALDAEQGRAFSQPFVSGMFHPSRKNILGDVGLSDPAGWKWSDKNILAVVLVYGNTDDYDDKGDDKSANKRSHKTIEAQEQLQSKTKDDSSQSNFKKICEDIENTEIEVVKVLEQRKEDQQQYLVRNGGNKTDSEDPIKSGLILESEQEFTLLTKNPECEQDRDSGNDGNEKPEKKPKQKSKESKTETKVKQPKRFHHEPFGFADGISQPILKGTRAGQRNKDSIHLVEPGEFILGYRDNSGYFPPSPIIEAELDVVNRLPNPTEDVIQRYPSFHPSANPPNRDLGRNGSYLVIRKLEQDVEAFKYTAKVGAALLLMAETKEVGVKVFGFGHQIALTDIGNDPADTATFFSDPSKWDSLKNSDGIKTSSDFEGADVSTWEDNPLLKELLSKYEITRKFDEQKALKTLETADPTNSDDREELDELFKELKIVNDEFRMRFDEYSKSIEYLFVGRRKDGTSLVDQRLNIKQPKGKPVIIRDNADHDVPATSTTKEECPYSSRPAKELKAENEFLFRDQDPQGYKCPFGSHIRRANPRDGLNPESTDSMAVTQRHRIIRRGRTYKEEESGKMGTFFMCLNADIDRQFELLQQTWLMSTKFHGLRNEFDPVAGQGMAIQQDEKPYFTIQHPKGDIRIPCMSNFVTVKAGGYFFLPGKAALEFFGNLQYVKPGKVQSQS